MKSRTLRAGLALVTAAVAAVGFSSPSQAASVDGQAYSFPLAGTNVPAGGDADATGNVSGTVDGTNLNVVAFLDNVDVESVVMHFHDGTTCDAAGAIAVDVTGVQTSAPDAAAVEIIDGRFVLEKTVALGTADMENVYFNVHEAGNLGNVIACGVLDATPTPQISPHMSETFVMNGAQTVSLNDSDVVADGSVTLEGTRLTLNLDYTGADLNEASRHMLVLRNSNNCSPGTFANLTTGLEASVTSFGSTEARSDDYTFLNIFDNSPWIPTAGATPAEDALAIDTTILLTAEQAENLGSYALVLLGREGQTDTSRPADRDGLTIQETEPSNCALLTGGDGGSADAGNYYNLTFEEIAASGISGAAYLKNTTGGGIGSLELSTDLAVPAGNTDTYSFTLHDAGADMCAATHTAPFGIGGDNAELGTLDGNTDRLRTISGPLSNSSAFTGDRASAVNNGDYVLLVTNNSKDTALACAQLSRMFAEAPETPEPPVAFDGTVAEATSIEEILAASDYRTNADNTGKDQQILRLYTAFFNRDPDVGGVQYWIAVSKGEAGPEANRREYSIREIAGFFVPSTEFQNAFASVDNDMFVDTVYDNVLGREGEAAGVAYWNDILNGTNLSGANPDLLQGSRADVVFYVAINQEFINRLPYAPTAS